MYIHFICWIFESLQCFIVLISQNCNNADVKIYYETNRNRAFIFLRGHSFNVFHAHALHGHFLLLDFFKVLHFVDIDWKYIMTLREAENDITNILFSLATPKCSV